MNIREFLSACMDEVFAPAGALDESSSGGYEGCDYPEVPGPCDGGDWHNNFGTAADYQVPAESDYSFSDSFDWSAGGGTDDY